VREALTHLPAPNRLRAEADSSAVSRRRGRGGVRGGRGVPLFIAAPALVGFAFLVLPLVGLLIRAPWRGLGGLLSDSQVVTALRLSLECASAATAVSLVLGVPLAWVLARV